MLARPVDVAVLADVHMGEHRGRAYLERVVAAINAMTPNDRGAGRPRRQYRDLRDENSRRSPD